MTNGLVHRGFPVIAAGIACLGSASAGDRPATPPVCAVAAAALADLGSVDGSGVKDRLLDPGTPARPSELFARCPELLRNLPVGLRPATDHERARMKDIASANPVVIFWMDLPKIAVDGRTATIGVSYSCNGLCGAGYDLHYARTGRLWKMIGRQMRWVS